jgi:Tfp pilus assembly protein PilN
MKPLVNLAGNPFRNRRLFWALILLTFVAFSAVGLKAARDLSLLDAQIAAVAPRVAALEKRAKDEEKAGPGSQALAPAQTLALVAANELIDRKAFSWSQLLNDLERQIPPTVRVLRVGVSTIQARPGGTSGKAAELTFDVVGKSVTDVTQMMQSLERSGRFVTTPLKQNDVEGTGEVEFVINIKYSPLGAAAAPRLGLASQVTGQPAGGKP